MNIQPVYLVYISRSGSTFFASQLAKHTSEIVVLPELDVVTILASAGNARLRKMSTRQLVELILLDTKFKETGIEIQKLQRRLAADREPDLRRTLSHIGEEYAERCRKPDAKFALFQRGDLLAVANELLDPRAPASFIHLYRDPRGCLNSIRKVHRKQLARYDRRRMGRQDAAGIALAWSRYTSRVARLERNPGARVIEIQYESFCRKPAAELNRCAEYLGVRVSDAAAAGSTDVIVGSDEVEIHEHVNSSAIEDRCLAWQQELSLNDGLAVEFLAKSEMHRRGYEPFFAGRSGPLAKASRLTAALLEWVAGTIQSRATMLAQSLTSPKRFALRMRRYARKIISPDALTR